MTNNITHRPAPSLRLPPRLGRPVNTLFGLRCKCPAGKTEVSHTGIRLAKRRRAPGETKPPGNHQPEPHPDDRRGRRPPQGRLHQMDGFPDVSKDANQAPPRSGVRVPPRRQARLELRWLPRQRRAQATPVVELPNRIRDRRRRLAKVAIPVASNLLVVRRCCCQ